jgi:hypothetical protein
MITRKKKYADIVNNEQPYWFAWTVVLLKFFRVLLVIYSLTNGFFFQKINDRDFNEDNLI